MHTADIKPTTLKIPPDVREALAAWAKRNLTTLSAEVARSVRERAQRDDQEVTA